MEKHRDDTHKQRQALAKKLENIRELLITQVNGNEVAGTVLDLLNELIPRVASGVGEDNTLGSYQRSLAALHKVHNCNKNVEFSENLMVATLGSQEGAFENVRLNYSGEQGQTIRQLVSTHMIRRVAMCCLSSPGGKRQHLAVSHEKNKITVLQLSSLLKQHDSAKRKLTLTRLSSAPVPFTVLTITANPANDDYLAVCGLKVCGLEFYALKKHDITDMYLKANLAGTSYLVNFVYICITS